MVGKRKNQAAVELGRKGGQKGGPARAAKLSKKQLSESARKAVNARWAKYRAAKENERSDSDVKGGPGGT